MEQLVLERERRNKENEEPLDAFGANFGFSKPDETLKRKRKQLDNLKEPSEIIKYR